MGPTTKPKAPATANNQSEAGQIVDKIAEGKVQSLLTLVPEGQSPRLFISLIKDQIMGFDRDGNPRRNEDLLLFLYTCKRTGLDPLTRQIFAVFRWNSTLGREVMTLQTGIDGMRLVAQRSGDYAGQDDVLYNPADEHTLFPIKASCTVYKMVKGARVAFTASARWSEYVQTDKFSKPLNLWARMPYLMLGKCAEALALRKAFPNELSGLYSTEEMSQANNPVITTPTRPYTYPVSTPKNPVTVLHGARNDTGPQGVAKPPQPAVPGKPPVAVGTPEAKEVEKPKEPPKPEEMSVAQIMGSKSLSSAEKAEALRKHSLKTADQLQKKQEKK